MELWAKERRREWLPLVLLPLAAILLHLLCVNNYGYFRDEFYYLACARRLDWGYVDHPPLSIALLRLFTMAFGESLVAVRLPVVLGSGLAVLGVMLTAKRLGAHGNGLWLAGLCPLLSGMYLVIFSFTTMNALDIVMWAWAAYLLILILEKETLVKWSLLGVLLGLMFLNKASMLWLVAGLSVGLLVSEHRRMFKGPGPWIALALCCALAAPNVVWQFQHGWPTVEFAENAQREKLLPNPLWAFLAQQVIVMNIATLPVIVAGVAYGFRQDQRKWMPLSVAFLVVLAILAANSKSRVHYLAPAYPLVLATGAVAVQKWIEGRKWKPALAYGALAASSPLYLTLGLPWLAPKDMTWLIEQSPVQPPVEDKGPKSVMQGWADMFGWPELAKAVRAAKEGLSPDDRARCAVVTSNYGEAASLEHFGLKRVLSGHNNYWLWGPQDWDGRVAVFVNKWPTEIQDMFESFEQVGTVDAPLAVPEQNGSPVWIARGLKVPVPVFWSKIKKYL